MTTTSPLTRHAKHTTVTTHYRRLAEHYDEFLAYSPSFVRTLTAKMIRALDLRESDRLVDLGCGTALYSLDMLDQVRLTVPVVGVDPFPEMLARIPSDAPIERVATDAMTFSTRPGTYDKMLIKEAVHHEERRAVLFTNLRARLRPGGRLLLVHVPPVLDYPLFDAALRRARAWHAHPDDLATRLRDAGFMVDRDGLDVRHAIPTDRYLRMVEHRYMSVLSSFTDDEIADGLREMRAKYGARDVLEFTDHFDYITGVVPA